MQMDTIAVELPDTFANSVILYAVAMCIES
jgi:hypothetical protein